MRKTSHFLKCSLSSSPLFKKSLSGSGWSVEGVTTAGSSVSGDVSTVLCSSQHLTSFAVLVDVQDVETEVILIIHFHTVCVSN